MSCAQFIRWIVLLLLLSACSGGVELPGPSATPGPPTADPLPTETPTEGAPSSTPDAVLTPLRSDLASRLGVDESEIEVAEIEKTVWPDASLGCPAPGQIYAQVTTPGYLVRLQVQDEVYEYHTAAGGPFVLCQDDQVELPKIPVTPGGIQDGEPWMPVDPVPTEEDF